MQMREFMEILSMSWCVAENALSPAEDHALRVAGEDVVERLSVGHEPPNCLQALRAAALLAGADVVVAVAAIHQLPAVATQKGAGVVFVAFQRVQAAARAQVAVHVRIIAEEFVRITAGYD